MADRDRFAHLLRRATFGATAEEVDQAERAGVRRRGGGVGDTRAARSRCGGHAAPRRWAPILTRRWTATPPANSGRRPSGSRRDQIQAITAWWVDRMTAAEHQLHEKLVFFWHGHWATSVQKVDSAQLMLVQQEVFRRHATGQFGPFVKAMLRDAALIRWLDGQRNTRKAPNENLARELMELFTLGIGNYTEDDVKAGARALTGWAIDRVTGQVRLEPARFDDGVKTILGKTGRLRRRRVRRRAHAAARRGPVSGAAAVVPLRLGRADARAGAGPGERRGPGHRRGGQGHVPRPGLRHHPRAAGQAARRVAGGRDAAAPGQARGAAAA